MPKTHSSFFKMLSARTRVQILRLLRKHTGLTVDDLSSRIGVTVPTVSRHLQLLRMQNLVTFRQDAQTRYYEVNEDEITSRISAFLNELDLVLPKQEG